VILFSSLQLREERKAGSSAEVADLTFQPKLVSKQQQKIAFSRLAEGGATAVSTAKPRRGSYNLDDDSGAMQGAYAGKRNSVSSNSSGTAATAAAAAGDSLDYLARTAGPISRQSSFASTANAVTDHETVGNSSNRRSSYSKNR
jgi:hypothetical protein